MAIQALTSSSMSILIVVPRDCERVQVALQNLGELYPQAKFPPVTIAVGRGKPVGVGSPVTGVVDDENRTVLEGSLIEGAAELIAELIAGGVSYTQFRGMTLGHEKVIETAFIPDEDKKDLSQWLYNGTAEKPADLGYWVGYRIARSYYQHSTDKRRGIAEILQMSDPHAFLARSGWSPGMHLKPLLNDR